MHRNNEVKRGGFAGFVRMFALPPIPRAFAGSLAVFAGGVLTLLLLQGPFWCLPLFLVGAGFFLIVSGTIDHLHQASRAAAEQSVMERQEEIVRTLVEAKRQGRNPVRVLNEQKIHDFDLRVRLMQAMEERLQAEGSSESTLQKPEPTPPQS